MALFDEIWNYYPDLFLTPGLSEINVAEGVIALLLAAVMTTDTLMSEEAVEKVSSVVLCMNFFQRYSQGDVEEMFAKIGDFYKRYGAKPVIEEATKVVPLHFRGSLLAIASALIPITTHSDGDSTLSYMADELEIPNAITKCVLEAREIRRLGIIWDGSAIPGWC